VIINLLTAYKLNEPPDLQQEYTDFLVPSAKVSSRMIGMTKPPLLEKIQYVVVFLNLLLLHAQMLQAPNGFFKVLKAIFYSVRFYWSL